MSRTNIIEHETERLIETLRDHEVDPGAYLAGVVHRLDAEQAERRLQRKRKQRRRMCAG
jgi:hypothetical protein